jgi:two-component system response regulator
MVDKEVEILLVEDNPNDLKLALHAFRTHNLANQVQVARDGAEALEFIFGTDRFAGRRLDQGPKVIFLDLKLPLIDGIEVLRKVKSDPRTRTIPVVIMTSSQEERDLASSYALGGNSYIVKPVDFDKFTEVVRQLGYYWLLVNKCASHSSAAELGAVDFAADAVAAH